MFLGLKITGPIRRITQLSESDIQTAILGNLRRIKNSEWIKPTTTNRAGTQDILGHIEGRFIAIEVKSNEYPAGPSRLQAYRIGRTLAKGGASFWTNSWKHTLSELSKYAELCGFSILFTN